MPYITNLQQEKCDQSLMDYFQQVYVINLPNRRDRRREITGQMEKIGLSFSQPNILLFSAVRPDSPGDFPSIGARGCFLSHLKILQHAYSKGFERILIFEDDLNFAADFKERIDKVISELEFYDWSVFYGGYFLQDSLESEKGGELVPVSPSKVVQTSHFVGFRGPAIGEAISFLEKMLTRPAGDPKGGPMHVDGAYNWFRRAFPSKLTLLAAPELGYQRSSRTDIHELRWFDRMPVVDLTVASLRKLRRFLSKA